MNTIKEKIKRIKYHRLSEGEKWVLNLIDGMEMFYFKGRRNSTYFKKNNIILFELNYNIGMLRINSKFINIDRRTFETYRPYLINTFYNNVTLPKRDESLTEYNKVYYISTTYDEDLFGVTL